MLPKNLLRTRQENQGVYPLYISESPSILELARTVLSIFRSSTNEIYESLCSDIDDLCSTSQRHRLLRGLCHLLEQRLSFFELEGTQHTPEALRERIFKQSAVIQAPEYTTLHWRTAILGQCAQELAMSVDEVEQYLYCDLKGQRKIKAFDDLDEGALIASYNLSLAQTVLFKAKSLVFCLKLEGPEASLELRKLFANLKFHGLLFEVHTSEEGYHFSIDGPNAILSQSQKYGYQLAAFLPFLFHFSNWEARAKILNDAGNYDDFVLSPTDFVYPQRALPTRLSQDSQRLMERITQLDPEWICDPSPPLLQLGGQNVWVPDFCVRHISTKREAYIEILGFWRSDYLQRRIKLLKTLAPANLILILSDKLKVDKNELIDTHPRILFYKTAIRPQLVLELLEKCALRADTA